MLRTENTFNCAASDITTNVDFGSPGRTPATTFASTTNTTGLADAVLA